MRTWLALAALSACSASSAQETAVVVKENEAHFRGTISNMHLGVRYDSDNTLTVDGKVVAFDSAGDQSGNRGVWGRLIGISVPRDPGGDDYAGYNGKTAEVYCSVDYATGPEGEKIPVYTLYGDRKYFIRVD